MKKLPIILLILLMTPFNLIQVQAAEKAAPHHILVINAYHYSYEWTFNQNAGICQTLNEAYPDAIIYTEFLDWKRFPDEALLQENYEFMKKKYAEIPIELILTTDDKALSFALEHRRELFSNAPIAFSGIIESSANEIIGSNKNLTGVYETMDPLGTLKLMNTLQPDIKKIYLIHDQSESGLRTSETFNRALLEFDPDGVYELKDLSDLPFSDILQKADSFEKDSVVMMISYNISSDGQVERPELFCKLLASLSSVPIYSIDEFLLGNGIAGGTFLSGKLQGQHLGSLGVQILNGTPADTIAHVAQATAYTAVDEDVLLRYHLDKHLVSKDVQIVNEHFSFFDTYKTLVIYTLVTFIFMFFFILILIINLQSRRRSHRFILDQKNQLQLLNDQLAATDEELKAQNDALQEYQIYLKHQARHDFLTKLPNRYFLEEHMQSLLSAPLADNRKITLVFIDIDNFKYVNNTYGHHFGDLVLQTFAQRLTQVCENCFAARLGGDEFILVLDDDAQSSQQLDFMLNKIRNCFLQPLTLENETIHLSASIGYSTCPDDGHSYDDLIVQADMSMYSAKKDGKSSIRHYAKSMSDKIENDFLLISHLRHAYENKELFLHFQPQIDLSNHHIVGFEALLRWNSAEFGQVPPNRIIPIAESSGLILPIGHYILEEALRFAVKMKEHILHPFKVSINISVVQLRESNFINDLVSTLSSYHLDPSYLQIELTESIMIENFDQMIQKLNLIHNHGISISLDDFGTGYSSLTYLQHLPVNELKIDKRFVDDILISQKHLKLIDTIITLAKNLNLTVVAEGVETCEQQMYLQQKGCDIMQGYYYSKPLPFEDAILFCCNLKHQHNM